MNREDFLINYWRYYNILEDDFIRLTRYVRICESNYNTCSDEIIKQFLSVASEFENVAKVFCGFNLSYRGTKINHVCNELFIRIEDIQSVEIAVKRTKNLSIKPFSEWNKSRAGDLFWWKAYNEVKHNRLENYDSGNLRNLLNSLGALYFMELYLIKEIGTKSNSIDIPNNSSSLFEIVGFETRYIQTGNPDIVFKLQ